jgi:hypothetical protein
MTVRVLALDDATCGLVSPVHLRAGGSEVTATEGCGAGPQGEPRFLGSVVVTPSGRDGDVDIRVWAAIPSAGGRTLCDCPADPRGCIEARRKLRFISGRPLDLPILLGARCVDVRCTDERTTCDPATGLCVDAQASCDATGTCAPAAIADGGAPLDGGPSDAQPRDATIAPDGAVVCWDNAHCPKADYCAKPRGVCESGPGVCARRPAAQGCGASYSTCGRDGKGYVNSCLAAAAGVNESEAMFPHCETM